MAKSIFYYTCCNPLGKMNHSSKKKNLREVLPWMYERVPSIPVGAKICDECRKQISRLSIPIAASLTESDEEGLDEGTQLLSDPDFHFPPLSLTSQEHFKSVSAVNRCLEEVGESPVVAHKLTQVKYPKQKLKKITKSLRNVMLNETESSADEDDIMLKQLKEKFCASKNRSEKVQILTILPKNWSVRRVCEEFGASDYMVRRAKELVNQKGIMSTPDIKKGHPLPSETCTLVQSFYEDDEVSRMMPGRKDFVSVRQEAGRVQVQKRLVLTNLKEAYLLFKDKFPGHKLGFSKFAALRPKHCILAGASGTHTVCVCAIHQNVKLIM